MKTKKAVHLLLIVLISWLPLSGCTARGTAAGTAKIRISYVAAPLNTPSILERKKQLFESEFKPIKIEWLDLTTGPQQTQALASGDLDFAHAIGSPSVLLAASAGLEMKITGIYSRGPKSFMILTKNSGIQSAADLKGKKVGGPKGTVLQQLLDAALQTKGLTERDLNFISMDIPSAAAALENGSIDAGLLAGPVALKVMDTGARLVADGQGLVDGTLLTVVSKEFYTNHRDVVNRFMDVQKDAVNYMTKHRQEILAMAAGEVGLTETQTETLYSWYDFDPAIRPGDIDNLNKTQGFLLQSGQQKTSVDLNTLLP